MGKLKEYYHEEISRGIEGEDKDYAVTCMSNVSRITAKFIAGQLNTNEWIQAVLEQVTDFDNMHTPCQPK